MKTCFDNSCSQDNYAISAYPVYSFFLKCTIWSLFLTPAFKIVGWLPATRFDDFFLLFWSLYVVFLVVFRRGAVVAWGVRQTLMVGFSVIVVLSILNGTLAEMHTSLGDLNQMIRLGKYLLIYTLAVSLISISSNPQKEREKYLKSLLYHHFYWFQL